MEHWRYSDGKEGEWAMPEQPCSKKPKRRKQNRTEGKVINKWSTSAHEQRYIWLSSQDNQLWGNGEDGGKEAKAEASNTCCYTSSDSTHVHYTPLVHYTAATRCPGENTEINKSQSVPARRLYFSGKNEVST